MAIAFVASRGEASITAFPATMALTSAGTIAVGNTLVAYVANDNSDGSTGLYPTLTDPRGNTWTQRAAAIKPGTSNTGICVSVYTCRVENAYTNGDAIGISFVTPPRTTWIIYEFSGVATGALPTPSVTAQGNSASPTVSITPTAAGQLVVAALAGETNTTLTGDSDTTDGSWSAIDVQLSNSGSNSTSVQINTQYKIVTGTTAQSWTGTWAGAQDYAAAIVALAEEIPPDPTQLGVADLRVELLLAQGTWRNITTDVRKTDGITLTRGRMPDDTQAAPSVCQFTLDNRDGLYSPRYEAGALYGQVRRNTIVRLGLGNPVIGEVETGTGTTINYDQVDGTNPYPSVGVWAVAFTQPADDISTPAGYSNVLETDAASFTVQQATSTDGAVIPSTTSTVTTGTAWASAHVGIPNGTYASQGNATAVDGASAVLNTALHAAGTVGIAACWWAADPMARMQPPKFTGHLAPSEIYLVADSGPSSGPRIMVWAWTCDTDGGELNLQGANDGMTDCGMAVSYWTGADVYTPRFCGEVAEWPQEWDATESNWISRVTAGGVSRRVGQSQAIVSPLRGAFRVASDVANYWPMEEPAGSVSWAALVGDAPMLPRNGVSAGAISGVRGSLPLPDFTGHGARASIDPVAGPWAVGCVVAIPADGTAVGANLLTAECGSGDSTISSIGIEYTSSTQVTRKIVYSDGTTGSLVLDISPTFPDGMLGCQMLLEFDMTQDGVDVDVVVRVANLDPRYASNPTNSSGTFTTETLGSLRAVSVGLEMGATGASIGTNGLTMGHVWVQSPPPLSDSDLSLRINAGRGYKGTLITDTAEAVARDAGILLGLTTEDTYDQLYAGPTSPTTALQALQDLERAGQALLADAAGYPGMEWRPYAHIISQAPSYTLDYAANTITREFRPVDDDATTLNDATVIAWNGVGVNVVETGAYGAQPGGIGRYAGSWELPVADVEAARNLAGWLTNVGTLDAARWTQITLEMYRDGNATLDLPTFSIGDVIQITNLPARTGPATVNVQVVGFAEEFDTRLYRLTVHTRLDDAWHVMIWDSDNWADSTDPANDDARWGL